MDMIFETPTPDLKRSIDFYKRLNFTLLSQSEHIATFADRGLTLEINSDRNTRAGIKLFVDNIEQIKQELKSVNFYGNEGLSIFNTPSGMRVRLFQKESKSGDDIKEVTPSTLGNFAGLSLETPDIHKSMELWKTLGFAVSMGGVEQGWVALSNAAGDNVSLMKMMSCPHLFFNPSLTYFNGAENLRIIEAVRHAGIEITEEITVFNHEGKVDNIILRDPGGFGFFIFSD